MLHRKVHQLTSIAVHSSSKQSSAVGLAGRSISGDTACRLRTARIPGSGTQIAMKSAMIHFNNAGASLPPPEVLAAGAYCDLAYIFKPSNSLECAVQISETSPRCTAPLRHACSSKVTGEGDLHDNRHIHVCYTDCLIADPVAKSDKPTPTPRRCMCYETITCSVYLQCKTICQMKLRTAAMKWQKGAHVLHMPPGKSILECVKHPMTFTLVLQWHTLCKCRLTRLRRADLSRQRCCSSHMTQPQSCSTAAQTASRSSTARQQHGSASSWAYRCGGQARAS